jgi:RES domain-containing protein
VNLLSGRFYRIVFAADIGHVLGGVLTPEARFHHSGQPALYLSPSPEAAGFAVASFVGPDDPPRVLVPVEVEGARVVDLRDAAHREALGLAGHEPSVPWQPERSAGRPATSWRASDVARAAGADGMIYVARSAPSRWHLVLFRWNEATGARVSIDGPAADWRLAAVRKA